MDEFLSRFDMMDHYELLGVPADADAPAIHRAWQARSRRYDPTFAPPAERGLFERALRSIEGAFAVLSDPVKRHRYDQSRLAAAGGPAPAATLADFTWVASTAAATEVPRAAAPARQPSAPDLRAALPPDPRLESMRADLSKVIVEVERLSAAVHLLVARSVEPGAVRVDTLLAAAETVTETRATLAAMQAEQAEGAGRWSDAAGLWKRVARQRPADPSPLVRASVALRKGGQDLDGAEALAQRAIELDPDCADAHASLAVTQALKARRR
ncbi:MAG: DnaJ domain-containing protein [Polyangiales bacterium]